MLSYHETHRRKGDDVSCRSVTKCFAHPRLVWYIICVTEPQAGAGATPSQRRGGHRNGDPCRQQGKRSPVPEQLELLRGKSEKRETAGPMRASQPRKSCSTLMSSDRRPTNSHVHASRHVVAHGYQLPFHSSAACLICGFDIDNMQNPSVHSFCCRITCSNCVLF